MRRERIHFDITGLSYDEFVFFLFAREVPSEDEAFASLAARGETKKWNPWYWNTEVTVDVELVCRYYVRLFRQPGFLIEPFSRDQLEQGFWAVQTAGL
jgi:hypothetical protein